MLGNLTNLAAFGAALGAAVAAELENSDTDDALWARRRRDYERRVDREERERREKIADYASTACVAADRAKLAERRAWREYMNTTGLSREGAARAYEHCRQCADSARNCADWAGAAGTRTTARRHLDAAIEWADRAVWWADRVPTAL